MHDCCSLSLPAVAAEALKEIEAELKPMGLGLSLRFRRSRRVPPLPGHGGASLYRPITIRPFVASPYTGSRHNRGCAVDLTLIDLPTGKELVMPTPYDAFTKQAAAKYPDIPQEALKNRQLLQDVMLKHGFVIYPDEWWHFDFAAWKDYPVMDIPFGELLGK